MGSATTPTTVSTATMPTSMTDAEATRLGLKTYSHGTTYTGSPNSPTIILFVGGGTLTSVQQGDFIPYQTQDGNWRLKFSVSVAVSSTARVEVVLRVAGVVSAAFVQTFAGSTNAQVAMTRLRNTASGGDINLEHPSTIIDNYYASGDIKLTSKPSWAY